MSPALSRTAKKLIASAEAAVVGAGFGVALIGAMEIATAVTGQQWLVQAKDYTDYAPLVGGAIGAVARWIFSTKRLQQRAYNRPDSRP